ncbi:hypothetical protein BKA62DRAFT_774775 [Auriculariales sp. MPI-PUGE-AT-0066]|nr:hypothetical protein BKA62DRAFT_774775 [Auriculariales sp. MPI-PUGE-AT-0066]
MSTDTAPMPVFTPVMAVPGLAVLMPPGVPSIHLTMGAVVVASWSSVFTFAIVCAAVYVYYISFPKDRLGFKIMVAGIWVLCALDTIMCMIWSYDWTVRLWGTIPGSGYLPHEFYVNIVCCGLSTLVVQFFYAWRIWTISQKQWYIPALIIVCAITQLCFVIWVEAKWGANILFAKLGIVLPTGYGWAASGIIGDFIITGSLFYYLRVRNKDSAASETTKLYHVQRNHLARVPGQHLQLDLPDHDLCPFKIDAGMYFFLNDVILTKIYAFSLLTSLNARRSSNALFNTTGLTSHQSQNGVSLSNLSNGRRGGTALGTYGGSKNHAPVVRITETVDVATDGEWDRQTGEYNDKKSQVGTGLAH